MAKKKIKKKNIKNGFEIFLREDGKLAYRIHGQLTLDEALDLIHTMEYNILIAYDQQTEHKKTDEIYDRAVQGFSLAMDKFRPEKDHFHTQLTEEAIMKAENEIISEHTQSTSPESSVQDVPVEQDPQ